MHVDLDPPVPIMTPSDKSIHSHLLYFSHERISDLLITNAIITSSKVESAGDFHLGFHIIFLPVGRSRACA